MAASPPATRLKRRGSTLEIAIRERSASPNRPNRSNNLCAKCRELDLEKGLGDPTARVEDGEYWSRLDVKIADVGTYYRQPSAPGCELCILLYNSRITAKELWYYPEIEVDSDELHAYEVARDSTWVNFKSDYAERQPLLQEYDCRYLVVVPSGFVFSRMTFSQAMVRRGETEGFLIFRRRGLQQPTVFAPQNVQLNFEISVGRSWLEYCQNHHTKLCSQATRTTQGLFLIDCRSSDVILASPEMKYAALSYVWGQPPTENDSSVADAKYKFGCMPPRTDLPAVIRDAIQVSLDMGFDYLWIDKYCINQKNSEVKHGQISQMDSIYHNAEVTIIAAAGSDPTYGLPGISIRPRKPHPTITIGNIDIIPTLRHPQVAIRSSKWSTRGWTLQEAILSRRRLVFTDDQVYFECNAMNCHESVSAPFEKFHVNNKSMFRSVMRAGIFGRGNRNQKYGLFDDAVISPMRNFFRFIEIIEQYSARNLTDESDSLKALYGIFREFENSKNRVGQIYGVPFMSSVPKKTKESFLNALTWYHEELSKSNEKEPRPRRRKNFPSWSWVGWAGKATFENSTSVRQFALKHTCIEPSHVSINLRSGTIFDLSKFTQGLRLGNGLDTSPSYLQFRAPLIPSNVFSYDSSSSPPRLKVGPVLAQLYLSMGPWDPQEFKESLGGDKRQCIHWGQGSMEDIIMVLQSEGNNTWLRVGLIFLREYPFFHSLEKLWSGKRRGSPQYYQWLKERPTSYFRVS